MKSTLKKCLSVLLAFSIIFSSAYVGIDQIDFSALFDIKASAADSNYLTFSLNDDEKSYSVYSCDDSATGEIVIPETHLGLSVTAICEGAFSDCQNLTSVVIPEGIVTISSNSFLGCLNLESVAIPASVTLIGNYAFENCEKLKYVFYNSTKRNWYNLTDDTSNYPLTTATIHFNSTNHTYGDLLEKASKCGIDGCKYYECTECDYINIVETISAPSHDWIDNVCSVCHVNRDDFHQSEHPYENNCNDYWEIFNEDAKFIAITFSNDTETEKNYDYIYIYDHYGDEIGRYDGKELAGERIVVFGDTITIRLKSDSSQTKYGFDIVAVECYYDECEHTETIIKNKATATCLKNGYTGDTFCVDCQECLQKGTVIPANEHTLVDGLCENCGLTTWEYIIENDGITIIGYNGYDTSLVIPSTFENLPVKNIAKNTFRDCSSIEKITIPSTVTKIDEYAFYNCENISEVHISDLKSWLSIDFGGVNTDVYDIYYNHTNPLYYGADLYIGDELLTDLVIPEQITQINPYAFIGYLGLTSVTFHDGIVSVGTRAFGMCSNIERVNIPDLTSWCNIEFLPEHTGEYSYFDSNPLAIGADLYVAGKIFDKLIIPDTVTRLKSYTFQECSDYNWIYIPDSVESLSINTFIFCNNLTDILYEGSAEKFADITDEDYFTDRYKVHYNAMPNHLTQEIVYEPTCTRPGKCENTCACGFSSTSVITAPGHTWVEDVCSVCGFDEADIIKSEHPYANNSNIEWTIRREGAERIAITFSEKTRTEIEEDYIYIYDSYGDGIGEYSGTSLAGKRVVVQDDEITIRLSTDSSITDYGFEIINIEAYYDECEHTLTEINNVYQPSCEGYGNTGDVFCVDCQQIVENGESIPPNGHSMVDGVCEVCGDSVWEYGYYDDNSIIIYEYNGNDKEVEIPATIEGLPVTVIGSEAFYNNKNIERITIPSTVTKINSYAFSGCENISEVHISDLDSWLSIDFGGTNAEDYDSHHRYTNPLYYGAGLCIDGESVTDLVIPEDITKINPYALIGCGSISSVTFHNGITSVGQRAFAECSNLKKVNISDLTSWCNIDFKVEYSDDYDYYESNPLAVGAGLYINGNKLNKIIIPDTVTELKDYTFVKYNGFSWVYIPDSVVSLSTKTFKNYDNLTDILYEGSSEAFAEITDINYYTDSYRIHYNALPDHFTEEILYEPTCVRPGKVKNTCECGNEITSDISAAGHNWGEGDICSICGFDKADIIESEHPYADDFDDEWTIYKEGAKRIAITFSENTVTEEGCDHIYLYNNIEEDYYQRYSGTQLAGKRVVIPGDTVTIRLQTDYSVTEYGFAIIYIEYYYDECEHTATEVKNAYPATCESEGYTGNLVCVECQQVLENGESIPRTGHKMVNDTCTVCGENTWVYEVNRNKVTIFDYNGSEKNVVIPGKIENFPVTVIGSNAFYNNKNIEKITIPSTVTKINNSAFNGCENISEVHISDLESWLSIDFGGIDAEDYYTNHNNTNPLYYGAGLYIDGESVTDLVIPEDITKINPYALIGCSSISSVTFHNGITSVGQRAFAKCSNLKKVNISDLTSWCNIDFKVEYSDGYDYYESNPLAVGAGLYINGNKLNKIIIPDTVTELKDYTFVKYNGFSWVYIPDSVESLSTKTFKNCDNLTDIVYEGSSEAFAEITGNNYYYEDSYYIHYNASSDHFTEVVASEPSCTRPGKIKNTCDCVREIKTEIPALGHKWVEGVCSVCGFDKADIIESEHPYANGFSGEWTITRKGAKHIAVTFSENTKTERECDYITIYDSEGNVVGVYSGTELSGKRIVISDDEVCIRLKTDESVTEYGFEIINIEAYYEDCTHTKTEIRDNYKSTCTHNGYTGTTYCLECDKELARGEELPIVSDAHKFETTKNAATCVREGCTTRTCIYCDYAYNIDFIPATGIHKYNNGLCNTCGGEDPDATVDILSVGETKKAIIGEDEEYYYFYFTPVKSGVYSFFTEGYKDTYGYIYDSSFNEIAKNDDAASENNFKVTAALEAGERYIIACRFYSIGDYGSFDISCIYELYALEGTRFVDNFIFIPGLKTAVPDFIDVSSELSCNFEASFVASGVNYFGTGSKFTYSDEYENEFSYTLIVDGDLNGDSVCDVVDAALAQRYSVGYDTPEYNEIVAANGCVSEEIDINSYQNVVNLALAS